MAYCVEFASTRNPISLSPAPTSTHTHTHTTHAHTPAHTHAHAHTHTHHTHAHTHTHITHTPAQCGVVLGLLLMYVSGYLTIQSCSMLLTSAHITERPTYELLGE